MQLFQNKIFHRFAQEIQLENAALIEAVEEMKQGLYEASLGANVYKKRIALGNRGKSGGVRTIVAFKSQTRVVFMYGFSKNKKDNVTERETLALKKLAKVYLTYTTREIEQAVKQGELIEVKP